jgi:hypothetical protein
MTNSPTDEKLREIKEVSLLQLSVRVCWLDDWKDVGSALENLLTI